MTELLKMLAMTIFFANQRINRYYINFFNINININSFVLLIILYHLKIYPSFFDNNMATARFQQNFIDFQKIIYYTICINKIKGDIYVVKFIKKIRFYEQREF